MMTMLLTGLLVMAVMSLAHHLGLLDTVAKLAAKVLSCPKCMTFWCCLALGGLAGDVTVTTVFLSMAFAYLSMWAGLLLIPLNKLYTRLWQRLTKGRSER